MIMKLALPFLILLFMQTHSQQCRGQTTLYQGKCVSECPPNYIIDRSRGLQQCQICSFEMFQVANQERNICQCAIARFRNNRNGLCEQCHYSCVTCKGPSETDCLTCTDEVFITHRQRSNNRCVCEVGFFQSQNNPNVNCLPCHPDCLTCSGPTDQQCIQCGRGRIKDDLGYCICKDNFLTGLSGQCQCPSSFSLINNQCREAGSLCGPNQVQVLVNTGNRGQNIGNGNNQGRRNNNLVSVVAQGAASVICQCRQGLVNIKGECLTCGLNQIYNERNRKCQCIRGAIQFKKQCLLCPGNQRFNRRLGLCQCKKNEFKTSTGECLRCKNREYLKDDKCQCIPNYFRGRGNNCRRCKSSQDSPDCQQKHHSEGKRPNLTPRDLVRLVKI